ncbi:MAG: hypothetical protein WDN10_00650 [bacterium]
MEMKLPLLHIRQVVESGLGALDVRGRVRQGNALFKQLHTTFPYPLLLVYIDRITKKDRQVRVFVSHRDACPHYPYTRLIMAVRMVCRNGQWIAGLPQESHIRQGRSLTKVRSGQKTA